MELEFSIENKPHKLQLEFEDGQYKINVDDEEYSVDSSLISDNCLSLLVNGDAFTVYFAEANGKKYVSIGGEQFCIEEARSEVSTTSGADATAVDEAPVAASPMPGKVVKLLVKEGDQVEQGQGLVIVEAMKMENEIKSPVKGRVEKVNFKAGDLVDAAQPIIELEPEEGR
ncbi:MAG: biotin/lipoyl-binding protein [Candidatus Zixiibacteriota bacterium]|nr:MAG: biotin/lipoyl-binding protein [candidate division Zixibacteria bacterium]